VEGSLMVQIPLIAPGFPETAQRVGIKFQASVPLAPITPHVEQLAPNEDQWRALHSRFPGIRLVPFFVDLSLADLEELERWAVRSDKNPGFASWRAIVVPKGMDPAEVVHAVAAWPDVEVAYVECCAVPPSVNPADDPLSATQGYLEPAPKGIDAYYAWQAADGSGIGLVDLEQAWTLDHEDLPSPIPWIGTGSLLKNDDWIAHGTAVLGIIAGVDNDKGVIGIAPRSSVRVVSQWFENQAVISTANALAAAVPKMTAGDVLLVESSSTVLHPKFGLLPAEVDPVVFDLIKVATANGITVVEPAGNNLMGSNLDAYQDGSGKFIFNRASSDFRDSGAIIVGAAGPSVPHHRLPFSNYGSRVDCFAWGWAIATCGGFPRTGSSSPQTAYMMDFAGTSGASAIVAGAAVLLQSWAAKHGGTLSTMRLREVMSDPTLNTHSCVPSNDRIGVMPDLKAILGHLKAPIKRPEDLLVGILLGGVAQGGPGWLWVPGGGITPVPPRGENIGIGQFSPEKRDLLLGLAIHDMAGLVSDPIARQQIEQAGAELMRGAIKRITEKGL
jgi:hypothetical protein